ncbi:hypothetical protein LEP48_03605 [Isoptericola sp. NEAU-Y5]|uniref:Uncharacterized protein n=1 Tax=Isoptericola luteus TaxID=2879484 RepID=A0ABS7ZBL4_9MICO|nr:hypothetical protein [Isoptericola sp. NEAU-Y5]MCA5892439.1 hypothetical protein [Isoptericola sp. NEAU-Y5]
MDTLTEPFHPGDHVADDAELLELATFLAGGVAARRRCLTLTWLDADDRLLGLVMPVSDLPVAPEPSTLPGLGGLMGAVLAENAPGGSVVAVLERPGDPAINAGDRAWNAALRAQDDARVRGVFVAAGGAVRPLTLDDAYDAGDAPDAP